MDYLLTLKFFIMFSKTQTLQAFAYANGISSIELINNPNNDKRFVKTNTGVTMRVSDKVSNDLDGSYSVSWFTPEDGDASWMLHPTGTSNVLASLSFAPVANFESAI
jgi:hypothetical protein